MRGLKKLVLVMLLGAKSVAAEELPQCGTWFHRGESLTRDANRPGFDYSLVSESVPLVVHATNATEQDYARRILSYAEGSWKVIVDDMGFRTPRGDQGTQGTDQIDIYIRGDLTPGVGGYTGFSGFDDSTPESDAYGYLVIADKLKDQYIRGVVAHEFFHLVQMSYDWFEHPGFMEATAVWITDHVFDDENFYQNYYAYFNQSPFQSLDKISLADPYQYGAGLWFQYLDERFGEGNGRLVRELWELSVQEGYENTADYFMAMRQRLGARDAFDQAFREFGRWRIRVGSLAGSEHLHEAQTWPERVIPKTLDVGELDGSETEIKIPEGLQPYSHYFLRLRLPPQVLKNTSALTWEILSPVSEEITAELVKIADYEFVIILTRTFNAGEYFPDRTSEQSEPVSLRIQKL